LGTEGAATIAEEKGVVGAGIAMTVKTALDPRNILNPHVQFRESDLFGA
ncbi:MAG: hypothetical protein HXY25_07535, partial [Alphaproteobacteria bacterium]|nr:hypothetical protein [Alphaproteobacteria bacterium]